MRQVLQGPLYKSTTYGIPCQSASCFGPESRHQRDAGNIDLSTQHWEPSYCENQILKDPECELVTDPQTIFPYGTVFYTHGAGLDAPLAIRRNYYVTGSNSYTAIPLTNSRGSITTSAAPSGQWLDCDPANSWGQCKTVEWPGERWWMSYRFRKIPDGGMGSLAVNKRDVSGQLYMRNRYYDPATGRFTQQDPIGLAGGLNLYGFAGGDPVNFSDPFGLCPPEDDNEDDCQNDDEGNQKESYCPSGSYGTPPNCNSLATDQFSPGTCPAVSAQEWDLGQRAIGLTLTSGLEEGFAITGTGVVGARVAGAVRERGRLGWRGIPSGTSSMIHSHPSGRGIGGGDIGLADRIGIRQVSAGVGTNRFGSYTPGGTPVTCNMPNRPNRP